MSFWAYLLHCRGGAFYAGHTDNLDQRIAQHQAGAIPGFTADRQPVSLVWSEAFPTRDEAKAAEARVKGWSRAKKMALIRGDWDRVSMLAKGKDGPSTGSGRTDRFDGSTSPSRVCPELVEGPSFFAGITLKPHRDTRPDSALTIAITITETAHALTLRYTLTPATGVRIPPPATPARQGELWRTTCLELFARTAGAADYVEFNLSPSGEWAAYRFADYRHGMADAPADDPAITVARVDDALMLTATIARASLPPGPLAIGLSAVIEEVDGTKSYWALNHPAGSPDFHHRDCFALMLGAPDPA